MAVGGGGSVLVGSEGNAADFELKLSDGNSLVRRTVLLAILTERAARMGSGESSRSSHFLLGARFFRLTALTFTILRGSGGFWRCSTSGEVDC